MPIHIKGSTGVATYDRYYNRVGFTSELLSFDEDTQKLTISLPDGKVAAYDSAILSGLGLSFYGVAEGKSDYEGYGSGQFACGLIPTDGVANPYKFVGKLIVDCDNGSIVTDFSQNVYISSDKKIITVYLSDNYANFKTVTSVWLSLLVE